MIRPSVSADWWVWELGSTPLTETRRQGPILDDIQRDGFQVLKKGISGLLKIHHRGIEKRLRTASFLK